MTKLGIRFAGLDLINPFLLSSGPPTRNYTVIRQALQAGWAGVVTKTISLEPPASPTPRLYLFTQTDGLFNIELISSFGYSQWSKWIKALKKEFPRRAVIASIMGSTNLADWEKLATIMADSDADALELNVSCPHGMPERAMGSLIGQDKELVAQVTAAVRVATNSVRKNCVRIPVIVKLTPNVTDLASIARAAAEAGADALSGINTVKAFAGINIHSFQPKLSVEGVSSYGGYGGRAIKPIALRCVAEMVQATDKPVSAIGGITTWEDAVEFLLLGASTVQVCAAALYYGIDIIDEFTGGLTDYLKVHRFSSVRQVIGRARKTVVKYADLALAPRRVSVINRRKCLNNCQACVTVCRNAGFGAIQLNGRQIPFVQIGRCEGCGLCLSVCPEQAIVMKPKH